MHHAQRNIVIQTPDFNATLATNGKVIISSRFLFILQVPFLRFFCVTQTKSIFTAVLDACKRGVHVTIMLSWVYNALRERFFQGGTNVQVMKRMYKKLTKVGCQQHLTIMFYVARTQVHPTKMHPNHTKFMAVDDEIAIFGSGNMDTQSWHHSQETNIMVDSPLLVKEWMDLFKISQNTHLYGVIDPSLTVSPKVQIERMLAKQNTQPTHVDSAVVASAPVINNSQLPINSAADSQPQQQPQYTNNFNQYYNTFRGIYDQDNLQPTNNSTTGAPSITNTDFFDNNATSIPKSTYIPPLMNNAGNQFNNVQTQPSAIPQKTRNSPEQISISPPSGFATL